MQRPVSMRWRPFHFVKRRLQVFGLAYQLFLLLMVVLLGILTFHERQLSSHWRSSEVSGKAAATPTEGSARRKAE